MLTANERNYLLENMEDLLSEYNYKYERYALEEIIDEWYRQKGGLIEAFKKHPNYLEGKFMIAFDADYDRRINKRESYNFSEWVRYTAIPLTKDNMPREIKERADIDVLPWKLSRFFMYLEDFAERCVSEDTVKYLKEAIPEVSVHVGQKTSRVVNKICCYLGFDKVDGYNREFARYADSLSPLSIKRHTILSINPLDYLTMSFGNSWASCHTIDKANKRGMPNDYSGCYSSGTVSYMLDETSMVLYTVDASYDGTEYWSEPKINRQMFHYGEEKLVQGRLYPQDNDSYGDVYTPYRNIVQNIISTIFNFPNLWTLSKGTDNARKYIISHGTHYRDYKCYENCSLSRIKGTDNDELIHVGHEPICVKCGESHHNADNISCCTKIRCADCGCYIDENEARWVDGDPYCSDCTGWCERCNEYVRSEVHYVDGYGWICESCLSEEFVYCDRCGSYEHEDDATYIECEERYVCERCRDRYYSYCEDCESYFPDDEMLNYEGRQLCECCYDNRMEETENDNDDE